MWLFACGNAGAFHIVVPDMKYLQDFGLPDDVIASGRLSKTVGVESRWTLAGLKLEKQFGCELLVWLPGWSKTIARNLIVKRKGSNRVKYIGYMDLSFLFRLNAQRRWRAPKQEQIQILIEGRRFVGSGVGWRIRISPKLDITFN